MFIVGYLGERYICSGVRQKISRTGALAVGLERRKAVVREEADFANDCIDLILYPFIQTFELG